MESAFEILAEPNRRAILGLLVASEQSVGDIERRLRTSQPAVSKHLRVLREAGFVEATVDAQRRLYRLKPGPFQEVDDLAGAVPPLLVGPCGCAGTAPRPHGHSREEEGKEKKMTSREQYIPGPASGAHIEKDGEKWTLVLVRELRHSPEKVWAGAD